MTERAGAPRCSLARCAFAVNPHLPDARPREPASPARYAPSVLSRTDLACEELAQAPRAADLLIRYVADSLRGQIREQEEGRLTSATDANSG